MAKHFLPSLAAAGVTIALSPLALGNPPSLEEEKSPVSIDVRTTAQKVVRCMQERTDNSPDRHQSYAWFRTPSHFYKANLQFSRSRKTSSQLELSVHGRPDHVEPWVWAMSEKEIRAMFHCESARDMVFTAWMGRETHRFVDLFRGKDIDGHVDFAEIFPWQKLGEKTRSMRAFISRGGRQDDAFKYVADDFDRDVPSLSPQDAQAHYAVALSEVLRACEKLPVVHEQKGSKRKTGTRGK